MRCLLLGLCFVLLSGTFSCADDWRGFLGTEGNARSDEQVATEWSESENMRWQFDLPGSGSSSPIVVGDRVIVTCYSGNADELARHVVCVDKNSGKQLWAQKFEIDYREDSYSGYISEHGYASNTPVSDGESVFVFLGKGGVVAFDLDGKQLWQSDVGKGSSNRRWGSAASPVVYQNTVIVNASEEAKAIIALDKATGEEVWRQDADLLELAYGTPRLVTTESGSELVISVPEEIWAISPETGKLKWFAESPMTGNVSPSVIVDNETIYSFGGYRSSGSVSVRAGGKGDVTDSHTLWTERSSSYVATPLLHEGRLYWIDDRGIAYCTSAETGAVIYRERVQNLESGRPVYSSPTLIGGNIYVVTRRSGTVVYRPGEKFETLAQNRIAGDDTDFNASPAVSDGSIYLRSNNTLYCVRVK